jgi:phosphate starvation-inducible PhoH-like protein
VFINLRNILKRNQKQQRERVSQDRSFHIQPKNKTQQLLLDAISEYAITVALGPAGTGKTFISASKVAQLFLTGKYDSIILSRANVGVGTSLGMFPGTVEEKLAPWLMPVTSVLTRQLGAAKYEYLFAKKAIQMVPLEVIRGRSFERSLVLVEEAQNFTMEELKAITTRMGEDSKMILSGDASQSDVGSGSAIMRFVDICERNDIEIPIVEFGLDDVVRSDICGQLVKMFYREGI